MAFVDSMSGYGFMVFTFENVDFVIRRTLKCCIDVFWNLRPEAFDEMLFYDVAQGGTAPDEAAIKKHSS